jgi:hypothetical protein
MALLWRKSHTGHAPERARLFVDAHKRLEALASEAGLRPADEMIHHLGRAELTKRQRSSPRRTRPRIASTRRAGSGALVGSPVGASQPTDERLANPWSPTASTSGVPGAFGHAGT